MKVKYVGDVKDLLMPGVGLLQPDMVIDVAPEMAERLLQRPDFERVEEKRKAKKKSVRVISTFSVEGGEESRWEHDM
ncbi:MAG: hypothetical protein DRN81_02675 [Thermoproteota archaeon]|nr:MAG: hypothetical protein DRN81_02675 [Candidatus Korarchaeota archaeon]